MTLCASYGSCVGERTGPEKARVTYEELRQHRSNSRNLSRGVIFGSQYLVRGSWPLIPAQVAIPRKNDRRGCPNIWRWSKRKCVDGMKEACSKLYGGLPKCSSLLAAARTCFRLLHAYFSIFTRDHTVRTTQPGRSVSLTYCNAFALPGSTSSCASWSHYGHTSRTICARVRPRPLFFFCLASTFVSSGAGFCLAISPPFF